MALTLQSSWFIPPGTSRSDNAFNSRGKLGHWGQAGVCLPGLARVAWSEGVQPTASGGGLKGGIPNGQLGAAGQRWASVAVFSPGDLIVQVPGFDFLGGDGVLGSTVSHRVVVRGSSCPGSGGRCAPLPDTCSHNPSSACGQIPCRRCQRSVWPTCSHTDLLALHSRGPGEQCWWTPISQYLKTLWGWMSALGIWAGSTVAMFSRAHSPGAPQSSWFLKKLSE